MQQQHPIDNMMQTTMESIRGMVDVNTVVGAPVMDQKGTTIIPISKVSFGFVAGGGEYAVEDGKQKPVPTDIFPFAGGTGAGMVELLPQLIEELNAKDEKKKNKIFGKTDDELLDGELQ